MVTARRGSRRRRPLKIGVWRRPDPARRFVDALSRFIDAGRAHYEPRRGFRGCVATGRHGIDRATVRSHFLCRAATDKFFSGFRRLQCHAAEESGGPKFYPSVLWPPYRRPSFSRHGQRAGQAKKGWTGGTPRGSTCCCLLPHHPHSRRHPARHQCRRPLAAPRHAQARSVRWRSSAVRGRRVRRRSCR
jgi:hypothetical protein